MPACGAGRVEKWIKSVVWIVNHGQIAENSSNIGQKCNGFRNRSSNCGDYPLTVESRPAGGRPPSPLGDGWLKGWLEPPEDEPGVLDDVSEVVDRNQRSDPDAEADPPLVIRLRLFGDFKKPDIRRSGLPAHLDPARQTCAQIELAILPDANLDLI